MYFKHDYCIIAFAVNMCRDYPGFFDDFWMISGISEPYIHHETMRYLPISLKIHKICLRETIEVYFKHDHCIQFQGSHIDSVLIPY